MTGFTYKSYSFVDKDPLIDELRGVQEASGRTYKWVEERSGVTFNTMRNWFSGKTRRPQAATVNAFLRAHGYKLGIVGIEQPSVVTPMPPPLSARHVIQMSKYKRR